LPGTFSFTGNSPVSGHRKNIPWIFKLPCPVFKRLDTKNYFRNFNSLKKGITVANYEVLEGLFLGKSGGKRPCHICASADINIYNKCRENKRIDKAKPCSRIIYEISKTYPLSGDAVKFTK